jgi:hypothetical protein
MECQHVDVNQVIKYTFAILETIFEDPTELQIWWHLIHCFHHEKYFNPYEGIQLGYHKNLDDKRSQRSELDAVTFRDLQYFLHFKNSNWLNLVSSIWLGYGPN